MLSGILIGFAAALLIAAPAAFLWARRSARIAREFQGRLQAERLAELTALTGALAHEIRNPLSIVQLNLDNLAEDWAQAQAADWDDLKRRTLGKLDVLHRETERLDDILKDVLRYAGKHELEVVKTDLNRVVRELLDFFAPQAAAAHVRLRPGWSPEPLPVRLDVGRLKQALLNLLINAQQAMSETGGGDLLVRTRLEGRWVCVEIADTGPGIPPDRLAGIFAIRFSTKSGGTGFGLAIARRIVQEHGGTIGVHSEVGRGTLFQIRLPRAEQETPPSV